MLYSPEYGTSFLLSFGSMNLFVLGKCQLKEPNWYLLSLKGYLVDKRVTGIMLYSSSVLQEETEYLIYVENAYVDRKYVYGEVKSVKILEQIKRDFL